MKVLITGMTAVQAGRVPKLQYVSIPAIYREVLHEHGHDVEHRALAPEEPIQWDVALVGLSSPTNLTSQYTYAVLDFLRRAKKSGCKLVFYLDDWDVYSTTRAIKTTLNDPHYRLIEKDFFQSCRRDRDWALSHQDELISVVRALHEKPWPLTLVPKFEWGDASVLIKKAGLHSREYVYLDPTNLSPRWPVHERHYTVREREWVLAALSNKNSETWEKRQNFEWPIVRYGKRSGVRLTEAEVVYRYGESWGVLSPPYNHRGSGWWRVRYMHASHAKCLLGAAQEDLPPGFPPALELDSSHMLQELVMEQSRQLESWFWPAEQFEATFLEAVCR